MSISGLCQICESEPAQERCANCGTLTCKKHYEPGPGLCTDCVAQGQPDRQSDDVDVHRF
ncbi:hypothetical protein C491_19464 [Natronococcus amylolyticus DSM 10524]|uniref:HIT-type domain-containing protein n=1 Tax=Natronococcus amylolyticus DSM 10524 TaxID=1227497 RepID=L9WYX0_9EURY|nr:hypothetical protein [Natronococcus amylolyticus]ELY54376.1 hypothetical protein C491_19464 [Natronococcus amylolyticus DSM 10524]